MPFTLKISTALSRSPLASLIAKLQSLKPAPVATLNFFTFFFENFLSNLSLSISATVFVLSVFSFLSVDFLDSVIGAVFFAVIIVSLIKEHIF